jgi:hypothetical protein
VKKAGRSVVLLKEEEKVGTKGSLADREKANGGVAARYRVL